MKVTCPICAQTYHLNKAVPSIWCVCGKPFRPAEGRDVEAEVCVDCEHYKPGRCFSKKLDVLKRGCAQEFSRLRACPEGKWQINASP